MSCVRTTKSMDGGHHAHKDHFFPGAFFPACTFSFPAGGSFSACTPSCIPVQLSTLTSSPNLLFHLPIRPVPSSSSSCASSADLPHTRSVAFHKGWFVVSRVRIIRDRGEVVQCVNVDPSARVTCCGKWGTTGAGSERGCFLRRWDWP